MRFRAALNAIATGPLWSISSSPPAISMPSVVAVPTHIPPGSRVSVSVSNARTRPVQYAAIMALVIALGPIWSVTPNIVLNTWRCSTSSLMIRVLATACATLP